jgi:hypothetical protein
MRQYLICRHRQWFRPTACGYTSCLAAAGLFDEEVAHDYVRRAEGVVIYPVSDLIDEIEAEIAQARENLSRLEAMREACDPAPGARP